jgi:8-oxo-dGTP pyrophosphatase MutT (NUDIX family)
MAQSRFVFEQFTSTEYVESAGAILFRLSTREICVLHFVRRDEYLLAKGRRNCGESRKTAAIRELREETGYACRLLDVDMPSRSPPAIETENSPDIARQYTRICEPIAIQTRRFGERDMKLIWWYVAAIDEDVAPTGIVPELDYRVEFYNYHDVLEKLTFQMDRDLVKMAIDLVVGTYPDLAANT